MNLYTDIFAYLRAPTGHDTSTLVGTVSRVASPGVIAGATTIPLTVATTVALNAYDQVTIFDGSNSEVAIVSTATNQGTTTLPVQALQFAHATGTPLCSDGSGGSLASMIVDASAQIEAYCRQPLLQATHSNERLPLKTTRAAMTRDYTLVMRPKQSPVQSVSAVTIVLNASTTLPISVADAFIDADAQTITLATLTPSGGTVSFWGNVAPPIGPTTAGWVNVSYVAGYAPTALPYDIRQACIWLVSDLLSDRRNPTGAAEVKLGDMQFVTRLRGETTGRSVLVMRAESALAPYKQRIF